MYRKKTHIHFMGIGGIGMSGLALVLKQQGYTISGCDADLDQHSILLLQKCGCVIGAGHFGSACKDPSIDILVYSAAIKLTHPEILCAQQHGIPIISRAQLLAELMRRKMSIGVAGAHGKTTTSALISHIFTYAGLQPTCIVGGHCKNYDTNAWHGSSDVLIAEVDESDRSLAFLPATLAVITNIDREHLDVYADLDDIVSTFTQFVHNAPFYGKAIVCADDPGVQKLIPFIKRPVLTYSVQTAAHVYAKDIRLEATGSNAYVWERGQLLGKLQIPLPGMHMLSNAFAAVCVAREFDISFAQIAEALASFAGVERRFCYHGDFHGAHVFDDYAHHPTEIARQLAVARKRARGKLHVVFQPHRFTRTKFLWHEFINTFASSGVDHLIVTDIFPASEDAIDGVSSERLVDDLRAHSTNAMINYVSLDDNFASIKRELERTVQKDDLVLLLGAGKVFKMASILVRDKA